MPDLILNELIKIKRKKIYKILLILEIIVLCISIYYWFKFQINYDCQDANHFLNYFINTSAGITMFNICMIIISSECIGNEFSHRSIRQLVTKARSRELILTSKIITMFIVLIVAYILIFILGVILTFIFYKDSFNLETVKNTIFTFLNCTLSLLILDILLAFTISVVTKSTAVASIITIILSTGIGTFLSFNIFKGVRMYYIYYYTGMPLNRTGESISFSIFIILSYYIILYLVSLFSFKFIEIK